MNMQRKRSHEESEGIGEAKAESGPANGSSNGTSKLNTMNDITKDATTAGVDHASGDWQTVGSRQHKKRKKMPKKSGGNYPEITHSAQARLQSFIKVTDLRDLVLYLLADGTSPQWCSVKHHANVRKVVVLMIPGLEAGMFNGSIPLSKELQPEADGSHTNTEMKANVLENIGVDVEAKASEDQTTIKALPLTPDDFYPSRLHHDRLPQSVQPLAEIFEHRWPIKTPGDNKSYRMHSPLASVLMAPLGKSEKQDKKHKGAKPPPEANSWKDSPTRITEFLASRADLTAEGFVLHPATFDCNEAEIEQYAKTRISKGTSTADGWVDTPNITKLSDGDVPESETEKGSRTAGRKVLAIDCEMCITSPQGVQPQEFSLTRLTVIDWNGDVVLDEFVKPEKEISDYLTPYSGITPQMLEGVTTTLAQAQQLLLSKIDARTILVGHSLNSDLAALKITHPFIVDTALIYPHPRGPPMKNALKWIAQKYLSRVIQTGHGSTGHDSVEDARASLDLVKQKCEKGKLWGTSEASQESLFTRLSRSVRSKRYKVQPDGPDEPKVGAVVDWGEPKRGFGASAATTVACRTDADVIAGIKKVLASEQLVNDVSIPADGVDFVWARFRELDAFRGFWTGSKTEDVESLREAALATHKNSELADVVASSVDKIQNIWDALPPCTAFIVYSGSGNGNMSLMTELQERKQKHKAEYMIKKWDELSVHWTDADEAKLRAAYEAARTGVAFVTVK